MSFLRCGKMIFFTAFLLLSHGRSVSADSVNVTIETAALSGTTGTLAFDFTDGDGVRNNSVSIVNFSSDATLGGTASTGDVTGALPGTVTLSDTDFFNELLTSATLGTSITFTIDYTNVAGAPPDAFTIFLLDGTATNSLVTTDLLGDALLEVDMNGSSTQSVTLPTSVTPGVTVSLGSGPPPPVPEPQSALLAFFGVCIVLFGKRLLSRSARGLLRGGNYQTLFLKHSTGRRMHSVHISGFALGIILAAIMTASAAHAQDGLPSLDSDLQVSFSGIVFDRAGNTFDTTVTLTNISPTALMGELSFVLPTISPTSVTLANATCHTPDDKPVFVATFPQTGLAPSASMSNIVLKFSNPYQMAFTYTHTALAGDECTSAQVLVLHAFSDSRVLPDDATILQQLQAVSPLYCQGSIPANPMTLAQAMTSLQQKLDQLAGAGALESVLANFAQTNQEILVTTAASAMAGKNGVGSLVALLAAHQNDPTNPQHLVNAAGAAALLGLPNEALALLDAADAMGGDFGTPMGIDGHALALNNRGFALLQLGEWSQAQTALSNSLALEPFMAEARLNLGVADLCQGDSSNGEKAFHAGLIRSPAQPALDEAFDLSQGVPPNLPPLPYPAVADQLPAYRDYYANLTPKTYGQAIDLSNQAFQVLGQAAQQLVANPPSTITAVRLTNIQDAFDGLRTQRFDSRSPAGLSDLWTVEQASQNAVDKLADELASREQTWRANLPPCCSAGYFAGLSTGRSLVRQGLTQFLYTQGRFDRSVRAFADPWYRDTTGLLANIQFPLLQQGLSLQAQGDAVGLYGNVVDGAFIVTNVLGSWWQLAQGTEESVSPQSAASNPGSSPACPDILKAAKLNFDFFGVLAVAFNCEKVDATVAEPGLGPFAQLTLVRRGDWTVFVGEKGSLPGTSLGAKAGFFVKGNDDSFTDAGIKFSQSAIVGPIKIDSPFGFEAGIAATVQCLTSGCY